MKILHICKGAPDDMTDKFIDIISPDKSDCKSVLLSEGPTDWDGLVDDIFSYDRVICWW